MGLGTRCIKRLSNSFRDSGARFSFGLRHALDVDHIAAIDNVTRKLMQEEKQPVAVGLFFSLGHSTVVFALTVALAIKATTLQTQFESFKTVGGVVGTLVSAFFLFAIALANIIVLFSVYRTFRTVKNGGGYVDEDLDLMLANRGLIGRVFRRFFRLIEWSWQISTWRSIRAWLRYDYRGRPARNSRRHKRRMVCRSGRFWFFRRYLRPA